MMIEVLEESLQKIVARHTGRPDMALVALQEIQAYASYIPAPAVSALATALGVTESDVLAVISFYPGLRTTPPGRHRLSICRGDSCAARGAQHIAESVEAHLGITYDHTTPDGQLTCEEVYCLGNCALSPSIAIDEEVYGRCTADGVVQQLRELSDG